MIVKAKEYTIEYEFVGMSGYEPQEYNLDYVKRFEGGNGNGYVIVVTAKPAAEYVPECVRGVSILSGGFFKTDREFRESKWYQPMVDAAIENCDRVLWDILSACIITEEEES